jgi:hypothetical protein
MISQFVLNFVKCARRRRPLPVVHVPRLREIISTTLRNHPRECVFVPDAAERIEARALELLFKDVGSRSEPAERYTPHWVDAVAQAILEHEVYCPHEGIDRRGTHEYWDWHLEALV